MKADTSTNFDQTLDPARCADEYEQAQARLAKLEQSYQRQHGWIHAEGTGDSEDRDMEQWHRELARSLYREICEQNRIVARLHSRLQREAGG